MIDISTYGVSESRRSVWKDVLLELPTLDINTYCDDNMCGGPVSESSPLAYENTIYGPDYFTGDGAICQPVVERDQHQQKYQWGFSIIQLEVTLCLLTLWTFGICIMWTTAQLRLTTMGIAFNDLGKFKYAKRLTDAMQKEFKENRDEDIDALTKWEMKLCIKTHLDGGKVIVPPLQPLPPILEQSGWKLIQKWIQANKAWALVIPILSLGNLALATAFIVIMIRAM